jgi:hypothetical protein
MNEREEEIRHKLAKYRVLYITRILEFSRLTDFGKTPASDEDTKRYEDELEYLLFIGNALKDVLSRNN